MVWCGAVMVKVLGGGELGLDEMFALGNFGAAPRWGKNAGMGMRR